MPGLTCRGCYFLASACGKCLRCEEERERYGFKTHEAAQVYISLRRAAAEYGRTITEACSYETAEAAANEFFQALNNAHQHEKKAVTPCR